jgi:hypothetical protein
MNYFSFIIGKIDVERIQTNMLVTQVDRRLETAKQFFRVALEDSSSTMN